MKTYPHKVLIERDGKIVVQCNEEVEPDNHIAFYGWKAKIYNDWESRHQFFEIADKEERFNILNEAAESYETKEQFNEALKQGINVLEFVFIKDGKAFFKEPSEIKLYKKLFYESEVKPSEEKEESLRPCDCKDLEMVSKLNEQGIGFNDQNIVIEPNSVVLTMGHTTVKISMQRFKMFAEWYLEEQKISKTKI